MFRTRLTLKPGRPGTKRLLTEYGDRLVCVRYRYDDERKVRCKTVELIVDEITWPPAPAAQQPEPHDIVSITVEPSEQGLRNLILRLQGTWIPAQNTCRISYEMAALLNLTRRIVGTVHTPVDSGL